MVTMAMVPLTRIKAGDRLAQDVHSVLGGLIMHKNRVVTNRDLEVLEAFMIRQVEVDSAQDKETVMTKTKITNNESNPQVKPIEQPSQKLANFHELWLQLAEHTKRILEPSSVVRLPMIELRSLLGQLIAQIKQYQPMAVRSQLQQHLENDGSNYLVHKSIAVSLTSYLIGQWSNLPAKDGVQIALAGLLHDIGKSKISEDVLNKKEYLTEQDMAEIRRHTQYGYEILRNTPAINEGVKLAALQHHERIDGNGYPLHARGEQIHLYARIVAIADMFHAMTMNRAHKKAESPFIVLEKLKQDSFGKLDPQLVITFINKMVDLTLSKRVKLSDGRIGSVVFIDHHHSTRPWVSINDTIVRLSDERELCITDVLVD